MPLLQSVGHKLGHSDLGGPLFVAWQAAGEDTALAQVGAYAGQQTFLSFLFCRPLMLQ